MLMGARSLSGAGDVLVWLSAACGAQMLAAWYWREFKKLRIRARRVRAWRARMQAAAEKPFDMRLLSRSEATRLVGRGRVTTEQWARAAAADVMAGRRPVPTCGEYLAEFGRRPRVVPLRRV